MNNYHTACTCLSFLLCIFKCLIKLTCQSGCKVTLVALIFIFYAFSNVSSNSLHKKLSLLQISLNLSVELLIFSLTILRFCLHMLSKCLINVKQMVYYIFADLSTIFFGFVDNFFRICRRNFLDLSTKISNVPMTLSNDHIIAWVTRPERPKGAKDEVKRPEGPPTRSWGPEGP